MVYAVKRIKIRAVGLSNFRTASITRYLVYYSVYYSFYYSVYLLCKYKSSNTDT